jgi:hypothetical protein
MLTTAPQRSSNSGNFGIAVISLLSASTANWPNTTPLAEDQALIRWIAALSLERSKERRNVLPPIAIRSPGRTLANAPIQPWKHRSNASGRIAPNTRPKVSCQGIPCGSSRNVLSHLRLAYGHWATSCQLSVQQIAAKMAMMTNSSNRYRCPRRHRGSGNSPKYCRIDSTIPGLLVLCDHRTP